MKRRFEIHGMGALIRPPSKSRASTEEKNALVSALETFPELLAVSAPEIGIFKQCIAFRTDGKILVAELPVFVAQPQTDATKSSTAIVAETCPCVPGVSINKIRSVSIALQEGLGPDEIQLREPASYNMSMDEVAILHGESSFAVQHCIDHLRGISLLSGAPPSVVDRAIVTMRKQLASGRSKYHLTTF